MSNTYDVGNAIVLSAIVTNQQHVLADPGELTCTVKKPDGTIETFTYTGHQITRNSVGNFSLIYPSNTSGTDQVGNYYYRFVASAGMIAASDEFFTISSSPVLGC